LFDRVIEEKFNHIFVNDYINDEKFLGNFICISLLDPNFDPEYLHTDICMGDKFDYKIANYKTRNDRKTKKT